MRRNSTRLILSSLAIASTIAGCTLIAEVDRTKIPDDSGQMGGMGGTGSGGSAPGGMGGLGGDSAQAGSKN